MKSLIATNPAFYVVDQQVLQTPVPGNVSYLWNFGSLLGLTLIIQIVRGVLLAMHYNRGVTIAFASVDHIIRDVNLGWAFRSVHANGARIFFFCLYRHIGRGVFMGSYTIAKTWVVGVVLLLLVQGTAFLGYVLPWGQMSFWGATVITKLLTPVPFIGKDLVLWLWGGFSVREPTLSRFFALHYLLPFVIRGAVVLHLLFLHERGSGNPLGLPRGVYPVMFHPYFSVKDLLGFAVLIRVLVRWSLANPWALGDPENFLIARIEVTPQHIQPEWYFLFAYAILRSVPSKLGGVIAIGRAILIYAFMPLFPKSKFRGVRSYPISHIFFWTFVVRVILLTWVGAREAKEPYKTAGQWLRVYYFSFFFINPLIKLSWDRVL